MATSELVPSEVSPNHDPIFRLLPLVQPRQPRDFPFGHCQGLPRCTSDSKHGCRCMCTSTYRMYVFLPEAQSWRKHLLHPPMPLGAVWLSAGRTSSMASFDAMKDNRKHAPLVRSSPESTAVPDAGGRRNHLHLCMYIHEVCSGLLRSIHTGNHNLSRSQPRRKSNSRRLLHVFLPAESLRS